MPLADCAPLRAVVDPCDHPAPIHEADETLRLELFEEMDAAREQLNVEVGRFGDGLAQSGLLAILEVRLPETYAHTRRVARFSEALARAMRLSGQEVRGVRRAALLHDIGKIAIPTHLLRRRGPLDEDEVAVLQMHVSIGAGLLAALPSVADVAPVVAATHERYDGTGYPNGLSGSDIPLGARIIAVADCYDAMVARRPYCEPVSRQDARNELARCAGSHFDPAIVAEWLGMFQSPGYTLPSADSRSIPVQKH